MTSPTTANHRIGTLVFLIAGLMFFAGLVAAYLVLRYAGPPWPSPGMPSLPTRLAGFNTLVICSSSLVLARAQYALRTLDARGLRRGIIATAILGVVFLLLQMVQWSMLFSDGLSFAGTTYGSTFYVITGAHAAHAIAGVIWLSILAVRQREPWVSDRRERGIEVCALFWHFVGIVWLGLYVVLYLI